MKNIFYHSCPIILDVGSIILPGNWGRVEKAIQGQGNHILFREYVPESVRKDAFPEKPSRMEATFSCPDLPSICLFMSNYASTSLCYEVELVSPDQPSHVAPCILVGPGQGQNTWDWAWNNAQEYWAWDSRNTLLPMEIVSSSALRIIKRGKSLREITELLASQQTTP